MAKKCTYSQAFVVHDAENHHTIETFTAVEFDAFDEAVRIIDKAVYDRKLQLAEQGKKITGETHTTQTMPHNEGNGSNGDPSPAVPNPTPGA